MRIGVGRDVVCGSDVVVGSVVARGVDVVGSVGSVVVSASAVVGSGIDATTGTTSDLIDLRFSFVFLSSSFRTAFSSALRLFSSSLSCSM